MAWKSSVVVSTKWERLGKEWRRLFKVLPWQLPRGSEEDHEYVRQSLAAIRTSKCEGNWYQVPKRNHFEYYLQDIIAVINLVTCGY